MHMILLNVLMKELVADLVIDYADMVMPSNLVVVEEIKLVVYAPIRFGQ